MRFPAPEESRRLEGESGRPWWFDPERALRVLGGGKAVLIGAMGEQLEGLRFELGSVPIKHDGLIPGWNARCLTPIPPGRWTLRVEDEGRVLFEREVTIESGQTTTLRW